MACSFGWDWGIDVAGAGIWKPIGLDSWSGVRIASVRPLVDVVSTGGADGAGRRDDGLLRVHVDVERDGRHADQDVSLTVTVTAPDGGTLHTGCTVPADETSAVVLVTVRDVRRWWPVGYGDQPLYGVQVEAETAGDAASWYGRVGFRTVELDTTPDEAGAPFLLRVNGERVLVRGANWIPDHAFLTLIDRDRYARRVADALQANINLLRVWGGGIYESDDLYDLADEHGLLMWQDFPFACAAYSEDAPMRTEIDAEARENVARLSPHPSLVLWNGNNENTWGSVDWGWPGRLDGRGWGDLYYRHLLPRVLAELDPTRPYSPASPYSFGDYRHPNDERYGTMHVWDVWNRADYTELHPVQAALRRGVRLPGAACLVHARRRGARRAARPVRPADAGAPEGQPRQRQARARMAGPPARPRHHRGLALDHPAQPGARHPVRRRALPLPDAPQHRDDPVAAQRQLAGGVLGRRRLRRAPKAPLVRPAGRVRPAAGHTSAARVGRGVGRRVGRTSSRTRTLSRWCSSTTPPRRSAAPSR